MGTISTAIGIERRSSVSGFQSQLGFFNEVSNNLPQIILILGEANTANQGSLDLSAKEITSATQAGLLYGEGSPIHQVMSILRPASGDGVGGIPTVVIPQASDEDATETTIVWTVTGTATKNKTHYVRINGRDSVNGTKYSFNVVNGDTATAVASKIKDCINNILSSPVIATSLAGAVTSKTKWKGLTSINLDIEIDVDGDSAGLSYAQTSKTEGSGSVDLQPAFAQFEDTWYTCIVNTYGEDALEALEVFNGFPDDLNPTGRWEGRTFKPFVAYFGSTLSDVSAIALITNDSDRRNQCTNALCPAPNSKGFPFEAAANMVYLFSKIAQNTPHLDVDGLYYPDMPTPVDGLIGDMSDYNNRDFLVKKGSSTVSFKNGKYQVNDLVTTYVGEGTQYSYPRNLNINWNFKNGYSILEQRRVKGHVIVNDKQVTDVPKSIKPKEWKSLIFTYIDECAEIAIIEDPQFSKNSVVVQRSEINTDRFETTLSLKITGFNRVQSTTAKFGF